MSQMLPSGWKQGLRRILMLLVVLATATSAFASHFRFGLITATRLSETATTVTYRLNVSLAWRLGSAPTAAGFSISGGNSGSVNVPLSNVTDPSGAWTNSSGTATVTLNKTSVPTRIEYASCCKISTISNNNDGNWDVYTILSTSQPGSTPVSTLPAIINMPVNATSATYTIPASDPDAGASLSFGVPAFTGNLSGLVNPGGFSISSGGQITFNTVGKSVGQQYNAMVTVTDNNGNQIMLDFLINMVGASTPPVFDYGVTPTNGQVFNVIAGQNISFPIKASDIDAGSSVSFSVSGLPSYISTGNFTGSLGTPANPKQTTFSWTPAAAQIGSTVVLNFIATDNVGVQSTSSVTIKVVAEPAPVFVDPTPGQNTIRQIQTGVLHQDQIVASSSLGSNVSIAFATVPAGVTHTPAVPTAGANPGQTTFNWTPTPANWGTHTITYQATIANIPTIFASRSYQLIVNTPPAFSSTPATTSVNGGQPFVYNVTVADADMAFGDQVDIIATGLPSWLTLTPAGNGKATLSGTPGMNDGGTYTIHLEAEDVYHHGNPEEVAQEFELTVVTCTPTASAQNIIVLLDANGNAHIDASDINNGSSDNCGIRSVSVSPSSFSCSDLGDVPVTLTVTNIYGVVATTTAIVTVVDNTKPVITDLPADITVPNDPGQCGAMVRWNAPGATDNCSASVSLSTGLGSGSVFPLGTTTVIYEATDASGNRQTASFSVTVVDREAPVVTAPADLSVDANNNCVATSVMLGMASATDNCGVPAITNDAPAVFPIGQTIVTWKAVDANGNESTATQVVTVADHQAPAITAPAAISAFTNSGCSASGVDLGMPATSDNCGVASVTNDAPASFPLGSTTVTWTVTDIHGNSSSATQVVTVADNVAPTISAPANVSVSTDNGVCKASGVAIGNAMAADNCTVASVTNNAPAVYPVGTTIVTWTATDASGNTATATQSVTVADNEAPVLNVPAARFFCFNGSSYSIPAMSASDNCGVASISYSISGATTRSGNGKDASGAFAIGTSTITWTVTDIHGNVNAASTTVVINAPVSATIPGVYAVSPGGLINTLYIGYGPTSLSLSAQATGGTGSYSYAWSTGANTQSVSVAPTALGNTSYSVVVTDSKGCVAARASVSVRVVDVRCGNKNDKVSVCQKTSSATNPWVQICVAPAAVATHLANGSTLGLCGNGATTRAIAPAASAEPVAQTEVLAYPNPSRGTFNVQVKAARAGKLTLVVVSANGTELARKELQAREGSQQVSFDLGAAPAGVYLVKVLGENGGASTRVLLRH